MLNILRLIFFAFFAIIGLSPISAQSQPVEPENQSPIREARELMRTRDNAEALNILTKYGKTLEITLKREQDSLLQAIENNFQKEQRNRIQEISDKESRIAELKSGNSGIKEENRVMTTNTMFFFGILIGIIVLILLNRFKVLVTAKENLIHSEALLDGIRKEALKVSELEVKKKHWHEVLTDFHKEIEASQPLLTPIIADKQHALYKTTSKLINSTQMALHLMDSVEEEPDTLVETNLNALIEEVILQSYFSMQANFEGFNCTIVRDLEAILPKIEVIHNDIRFVLFNLLRNGFESIHEKSRNAPKGYEPKLIISTRKLPRFVQIRVKDTGSGVSDKIVSKIFEPFYSTKAGHKNPGLGLSESYKIITVKHKGELYIESDISDTTDFVIRFPTLTIM